MPGSWVQSAFPAVGRLSKGFPVLSSSPTVLHVLLEQCLKAEYPKVLNSGNLALIYPAVAVMCNGKRMLTRPLSLGRILFLIQLAISLTLCKLFYGSV